ncbi:MAG: carbohydrate binding family 9 domain-containing protein [Candidatus Aminicenantes bacterium]|nr:carbohydrate binding family 9 domain-containing protein [Candidatus Aminicenantes bacterium]
MKKPRGLRRLAWTCIAVGLMSSPAPATVPEVRPLAVDEAIAIDGRLDEPAWGRAAAISDFVQFRPERGRIPAFATEARVLLAPNRLIVGFFCRDAEPERITARLTRRDSDLTEDDCVCVALDTFFDRRTAYYFFTNPLGTQQDGRLSENGRVGDDTWDGEWRSAAARFPGGWSAEIEVPLATLKFDPRRGASWGLGLGRSIPRTMELDTWPGPVDGFGMVSQFGVLSGLDLAAAKKKLEVIPHLVGRLRRHEKAALDAGADLRWALSQDISANLAFNPDFATIEADQEQINLTRFELSLSEKRNFFLEGSEIYSQRIQLFYSRRVADIWGGAKLYGKKGGTEFAAMGILAKADEELELPQAGFAVLRVRRDIFSASTIGFLTANRIAGGRNHGSSGLDLVHFFSDRMNVTGQLAISYGDHARENLAFFLRPSYDSATAHFHLRYTHLGRHFADNANAAGFVSDDDRRELDSALEKTWSLKRGLLERVGYSSNYNIYWSTAGTLRSWEVDQELELDLRNRLSLELEHGEEFKLYEEEFRNRSSGIELGFNTREWQMARLGCSFGRSFGSRFRLWEAGLNRKLGDRLSLEYDLNRLLLDPDPEDETTWIHVLRLDYFFNKDLFLKLFFQRQTALDKTNVQLVFVWRFQPPFGMLQLAFQQGSLRFGERGDTEPALFLKLALVI